MAVVNQQRQTVNGVLNIQTRINPIYADHLDTPRMVVRGTDHAMLWRWDDAEVFGHTPANANPSGLNREEKLIPVGTTLQHDNVHRMYGSAWRSAAYRPEHSALAPSRGTALCQVRSHIQPAC